MRSLILELSKVLNIPCDNLKLRCTLFEDNKGAEELAKVPKNRPSTKHIEIKYHHFREWVKNGILSIQRVDKNEQQEDIFTKPLILKVHEYLREKIMGWCCVLTKKSEDITKLNNMRFLTSVW